MVQDLAKMFENVDNRLAKMLSNSCQKFPIVDQIFPDSPGNTEKFFYATNVKDAKESLEVFVNTKLENFGRYQDLMLDDQAFMFHASHECSCGQ